MMQDQRVIWDDDGTNVDISTLVNDYRSGSKTLPLVAVDDYLYIASDLPFNHRYIMVSSANDQASAISAAIWWSNEWVDAVDVIDTTSSGGATLAQSGILQWRTNRLKGWDRELDSDDVTGVDNAAIYDMYWLRLTFSGDLNANTAIQYIGHKFSSDTVLTTYYPDLQNASLKTAYLSGKTDWNTQHFMAAECIIRDLKARHIVYSANQILDYGLFEEASCHKVAELIYNGLGRPYIDQKNEAAKYYSKAMQIAFNNIDLNRDGNLSERERRTSLRYMTR